MIFQCKKLIQNFTQIDTRIEAYEILQRTVLVCVSDAWMILKADKDRSRAVRKADCYALLGKRRMWTQ
jgi:hypothetical protein